MKYRGLFVSDIHMSNRLPYAKVVGKGVTDRLVDQVRLWRRIEIAAEESEVEAVFILGDLLDQSRVDAITLTETVKAVTGVAEQKPVYILGGNHDAVSSHGGRFTVEAFGQMKTKNVFYLDESAEPISIGGWLNFWPIPYCPIGQAQKRLKEIAKVRNAKKFNVGLLHHSILGANHEGWTCDDGLDPEEARDPFDVTLSGHFHTPQYFGEDERGMYLGAPLRWRFDDSSRDAFFWTIDFFKTKSRKWKPTPHDPKLPRFHVYNWGDKKKPKCSPDDYLKIKVEATHAEFARLKPEVIEATEEAKEHGVRAHWKHIPVYQHTERLRRRRKRETIEDMMSDYVDALDVNTDGLNKKHLKRLGREGLAMRPKRVAASGSLAPLGKMTGSNFCQFEEFALDLSGLGLCWLGGENRDTASAVSNGSGKSNLLKGIGWVIFGETIEDKSADDVIRIGTKETKMAIELGESWRVERARKKGRPSLKLFDGDHEFEGSSGEIQEKIVEIVGYDWHTFRSTVFYGSRDTARFLQPKTPDADRKKILHRLRRTDFFDLPLKWVKVETGKAKRKVAELETRRERARARIGALDLEALERRSKAWGRERSERVSEAVSESKRVLALAKKKAPKRGRLAYLRTIAELDKAIGISIGAKADATSEANYAERENAKVARRLAELEELDRCPVCNSGLKKGEAKKHLAAERKAMKVREGEIEKRRKEAAALDIGLGLMRVRREGFVLRKKAREKAARARELANEKNPFEDQIEETKKKVSKNKRIVRECSAEIKKLAEEIAHWEFWRHGFSPSGFPSFILDSTMPIITERANHYLESLSDGDITMEFSTQKEIGSGEKRDKIGISWVIEEVEDKTPSGAQWRKMEIATDLALIDLVSSEEGARAEIMCFDEVLDGLDSVGRQRLTKLLHDLRSQCSTIFVVSHDTDIAEVFERSVTVIKEDGVARLEAA